MSFLFWPSPLSSPLLFPRAQCVDSSNKTLAVWTRVQDSALPNYHGKLVVFDAGYVVITEIVATLVLNRIAAVKGW